MLKVYINAKKEHIACLQNLCRKLKSYLELHPIPANKDDVMEIMPIHSREDLITWAWGRELSLEQSVWQGLCDSWLRGIFSQPFSTEVQSVMIKIHPLDSFASSIATSADENEILPDKLIKGEGLASFASVKPRYKMDKLIVSPELRSKIENTISILANTNLIYDIWGFSEVESCPRAVLNFFGPPGTGKTMAAHCIADRLGKNILVANFAEIESKYVGDSPKNLENIFHVAEKEDAILFFDEADSFCGKRLTSISSSSDQAINSLRSKLLQLLEEHTGIVIFCTNLLKNYDKAFESRILRSLRFDLPDVECRKQLIMQKIPDRIPFAAGENLVDNLDSLATIADGFSGREIKNAVLQVLCKAAADVGITKEFTVKDFEEGFKTLKAELEAAKKERGVIDGKRADELAKKIDKNLQDGNFVVDKTNSETGDSVSVADPPEKE